MIILPSHRLLQLIATGHSIVLIFYPLIRHSIFDEAIIVLQRCSLRFFGFWSHTLRRIIVWLCPYSPIGFFESGWLCLMILPRLWSEVVGSFRYDRWFIRAKGKELRLFPSLYFYWLLSLVFLSIIHAYLVIARLICSYQNPSTLVTILLRLRVRINSLLLWNKTRYPLSFIVFFGRVLSCVPGKVRSLGLFPESSVCWFRASFMVLMEIANVVAHIIVNDSNVVRLLRKMRFGVFSPTRLPSPMGKKILFAERRSISISPRLRSFRV